jgi:hypothetical protein
MNDFGEARFILGMYIVRNMEDGGTINLPREKYTGR